MMSICGGLRAYLTRPIIPFCFGMPLLPGAVLLVRLTYWQEQDNLALWLHVLSLLLLCASLLAIVYGTVLGCRDQCCAKEKPVTNRPTTRGNQMG